MNQPKPNQNTCNKISSLLHYNMSCHIWQNFHFVAKTQLSSAQLSSWVVQRVKTPCNFCYFIISQRLLYHNIAENAIQVEIWVAIVPKCGAFCYVIQANSYPNPVHRVSFTSNQKHRNKLQKKPYKIGLKKPRFIPSCSNRSKTIGQVPKPTLSFMQNSMHHSLIHEWMHNSWPWQHMGCDRQLSLF